MHIMFIMMTFIRLVMSSYGGNKKVVGWALPEGSQVPTLRPILNVSDNLHTLVEMYQQCILRSMMSMNVLNLLVQLRLI